MRSAVRSLCLVTAATLILAGCTGGRELDPEPTGPVPPPPPIATTHAPDDVPALLASQDPVEMALAVSERYFASAHVVVMAPAEDDEAIARASSIAIAAGTPMLLSGEPGGGLGVESELVRLSTHSVITVGAVDINEFDATGLDIVPDPTDIDDLGEILGVDLTLVGASDPAAQDPAPEDPEAQEDAEDQADDSGGDDAGTDDASTDDAGTNDAGTNDAGTDSSGTGDDGATEDDDPTDGTDEADSTDEHAAEDEDAAADEEATENGGAAEGDGAGYVRALAGLQPGEVLDVEPADDTTPEPVGEINPTEPTERLDGHVVLADGDPAQAAAVGIARAAGAEVVLTDRVSTDPEIIDRLTGAESVLGLGTSFGEDAEFSWRVLTAATGTELPGGGQEVFGGKRYIALYGHPATTAMGILGEQGTAETIELAEEYAQDYAGLTDDEVIPTLEIIVTVATTSAGQDGSYSNAWDPDTFVPLIEAAQDAGQYVVLDFQPGRQHFLDQIEMYEDLLAYPHVGIALDPEWRLRPDQVHLQQIGHVEAEEVNEVVHYLADFVAEHDLPQKMLVLHQFQTQMIRDRQDLDTSRPEVAPLIHADGQGPVQTKFDTWDTLLQDAPDSVAWGWKNFIDEDDPMMTPEETYEVDPLPEFVSYQ